MTINFRHVFDLNMIARKLCTTTTATDVTYTLNLTLEVSGCDDLRVRDKPRLLSDNDSSYISGELADWLAKRGMDHTGGASMHPQTQGKIKCWQQTLKNRIMLESYNLPGDLD
jgi:putative transposase